MATALAIIFHVVGIIGIVILKNNFILYATSFNLLLMFALLIWTQSQKDIAFFLFLLVVIIMGFSVEVIGVNTKLLFGNYAYGKILGCKIYNVPILIGINWFIVIYCCGICANTFFLKVMPKIAANKVAPLKAVSTIFDGALMAVFLDWLMEPVAMQMGYWQWFGRIPIFNYLCWFVVSMALLVIFHFVNFNKQNKFAIHLYMIQIMFFLLLRVFLVKV